MYFVLLAKSVIDERLAKRKTELPGEEYLIHCHLVHLKSHIYRTLITAKN
jgi:hypothetical protein